LPACYHRTSGILKTIVLRRATSPVLVGTTDARAADGQGGGWDSKRVESKKNLQKVKISLAIMFVSVHQ